MDKEQIKNFRFMYPGIENCTIQTFLDCKELDIKENLCYKFAFEKGIRTKLEELNKKGAGIFFSVNQMKKGERDKANMTKINSWICDIDSGTKSEQMSRIQNCELQPSMIVESGHGYHLYYFCNDITLEDYRKYNWGLCNYYNGDTKIPDDEARVLRMPGFNHNKDPQNPFPIKIIGGNGKTYTVEDMKKVFVNTISEKERKDIQRRLEYNEKQAIVECNDDNFWETVCKLDTKEMLGYISGTKLVGYEDIEFRKNGGVEQIYCNGKSTSCWIDSQGLIGSYSGGGPFWTRWIAWYGKIDWKEIYRIVERYHPEIIEKYKHKEQKKEQKKEQNREQDKGQQKENIWRTTDEITWDFTPNKTSRGLDYLDNSLMKFDSGGELVVLYGYPGCGKTELGFFIARHNTVKTTYFCLEIPEETIIKRWALRKCGYTQSQVDNGTLELEQQQRLQRATSDFKESIKGKVDMISINQQPTIDQLLEYMYSKVKSGEIVIIDNLGKILGDDNENIRYADVSAKLQTFAYKMKCTVILQHHGAKPINNKTSSNADDAMNDLQYLGPNGFRGSQKIYDNATRMVEVHRDYRGDSTQLLQYKHTPTDTRYNALVYFENGEFVAGE